MRSKLLCLGLLMVLSACSSGGGGTAPADDGGGEVIGDPIVVAKAQPQGAFAPSKESALGEYGGVPTGFALPDLKCGDKLVYDSRLRVGDVFKGVESTAHRNRLSSSSETDVIRSVDETHSTQTVTFTNTSGAATAIEMACEMTPDKQNPITCDFKFQGAPIPMSDEKPAGRETCSTDYQSSRFPTNSGTIALGKFKLAGGQVVNAQRISLVTSNVDFKCGVGDDQKVVGTGKVISDQVETRDLITRTASPCTPTTTVYRKVVYQLDDGTILYANVDEKTQAPQR